jgi:L-ascorbate metabolism protein UlaG (beta-lactamase superfamily)
MGIRIQYLGQQAVLLEAEGTRLLINPFGITNLPQAEVVIMTHGEGDHMPPLPNTTRLISNPEITDYYALSAGLTVQPVRVGLDYTFHWGKLTPTVSMAPSRLPQHRSGGLALGYIIHMEGHRLYYPGETGIFGDLRFIGDYYKPNIAFLTLAGPQGHTPEHLRRLMLWLGVDFVVPLFPGAVEAYEDSLVDAKTLIDAETSAIFKLLHPGGDPWELVAAESSGRQTGPESRY